MWFLFHTYLLFINGSFFIWTGVVQSDPHWQTFMEQAVRLIYFLAESPDQLCSHLLQRSARLLLEQITECRESTQTLQEGVSQASEEQGNVDMKCDFLHNFRVIKLK